jgi:hypothetical protein
MRDVPVAADDGVAIGQRRHPVRQRGHEPLLLELAVGAGLTGLDVDARDGQPVDIDLHVTPVKRVGAQVPHEFDRMPAQHRNAVAALEISARRSQMPAVRERRAKRGGELVVVGPRLLQAHHVGPRLG